MDSLFVSSLSDSPVPLMIAHRSDVWVSYDIVRDSGLLLEPSRAEVQRNHSFLQTLRFSSTADFGGEFQFRIENVFGTWFVGEMRVIWMV